MWMFITKLGECSLPLFCFYCHSYSTNFVQISSFVNQTSNNLEKLYKFIYIGGNRVMVAIDPPLNVLCDTSFS